MKKGLFKKILVVMMCIALTLGMAACGSKKAKVGANGGQSSDVVKSDKDGNELIKAVAANKKGLENFTVSLDVKADADLDLRQILIMQGMTEEMIESALDSGEIEESDLKSSMKAGVNGTLKITDEAGYAEGKVYAEIPDVTSENQELKTYLVKEGDTEYVYEYDFDDEEWMKEESDTSLAEVISELQNVTQITDYIKSADVVSEKKGLYTIEAKLDFEKIIGNKEDDIKSAIEDSLSQYGSLAGDDFDIDKVVELLDSIAITVTVDGDNNVITSVSIDLKDCIGKIFAISASEDIDVEKMVKVNEASVTLEFSDFGKTEVKLPKELKDMESSDNEKDKEDVTTDDSEEKPSKEENKKDDKKDDSQTSAKVKYEIKDYDGNVIGKVTVIDGFTVDDDYTDENCLVMDKNNTTLWVTVFTEDWVKDYINGKEWEVDKNYYEYDKIEKLKDTLDTPNGKVEFYKRTFKGINSSNENYQYCAVITKDDDYFLSFDLYESDCKEIGMTIQEVAEAVFN